MSQDSRELQWNLKVDGYVVDNLEVLVEKLADQ